MIQCVVPSATDAPRSAWKPWEVITLFLVLLTLMVWVNPVDHIYQDYLDLIVHHQERITQSWEIGLFQTRDEYFLLEGYKHTPHLWTDGLVWWHGPWMHTLTRFYRPIASYLHWLHCDIGVHHSFSWNHWIGMGLYSVTGLLSVMLAWRMTHFKLATIAVALPLPFFSFVVWGIPHYWLGWFPMHPDLLCGAFLLGATLCFDRFIEQGRRRDLIGTWVCWLLAALTKEHAYVFPLMALTLAVFRAPVEQRRRLVGHALSLCIAVVLLFLYRKAIVPNASGPSLATLSPFEVLRGSLSWMYRPLHAPLYLAGQPEFLLAALWFAQGFAYLRLQQLPTWQTWRKKPLTGVAVFFGMVGIALVSMALTGQLIFLVSPDTLWNLLFIVLSIFGIFCSLTLLWRGRSRYPTIAIFLILYLAYLPVYFGRTWYYGEIGWFFRLPYFALLLTLLKDEGVNFLTHGASTGKNGALREH